MSVVSLKYGAGARRNTNVQNARQNGRYARSQVRMWESRGGVGRVTCLSQSRVSVLCCLQRKRNLKIQK